MQSSLIKLAITIVCISYILGYCTDINPSSNVLDCVGQFSKDSFCCHESYTTTAGVTNKCVLKKTTDSGFEKREQLIIDKIKTEYVISCRHPQTNSFCGPQFSDSISKCNKNNPIKGGVCCHDTKQNVCFGGSYHYTYENWNCHSSVFLTLGLVSLVSFILLL